MNERELTDHLRDLPHATPPPSWRAEILAAAHDVTPRAPATSRTTGTHSYAKAAIVLVWLGLALSQYLGEQEDTRLADYFAPVHLPCSVPISGEEIEWLMAQLFPEKKDTPEVEFHYDRGRYVSDPV